MALGSGIFAGKKTYIAAALGVLGIVAAYLTGDATLAQLIQGLLTAATAAGLRSAVQ